MASASLSVNQPANLNPTTLFMPVRDGNVFADSLIQQNDQLTQVYTAQNGFFAEPSSYLAKIGDYDGTHSGTQIIIDDSSGETTINSASVFLNIETTLSADFGGSGIIELSGTAIQAASAGAASGKFLVIKLGGVSYKINLLNV